MKQHMQSCVRILEIVLGGALTAAAFGLIVIPQGFVAGGMTGLALSLSKVIPLPLSVLVLAGNLLLLVMGLIFAGKEFIAKTLLLSWLFPILLQLFQSVTWLAPLSADPLLSAVLGGALLGLGSGLVLLGNGSSGGFDTLGVILNRRLGVPVSLVMYVCDLTVILLQAASGTLLQTVYGILVTLIASLTVNSVLARGKLAGQIWIFSEQAEVISQHLLQELDLGLSFFQIESGYLRRPGRAILTIVPAAMIEPVKRAVKLADPTAFVLVDTVRYVGGRGYTISR